MEIIYTVKCPNTHFPQIDPLKFANLVSKAGGRVKQLITSNSIIVRHNSITSDYNWEWL